MRVRIAEATGCPVPQFIVEAENDAERYVLHACMRLHADGGWRFTVHSYGGMSGHAGIDSFSFGWASEKPKRARPK